MQGVALGVSDGGGAVCCVYGISGREVCLACDRASRGASSSDLVGETGGLEVVFEGGKFKGEGLGGDGDWNCEIYAGAVSACGIEQGEERRKEEQSSIAIGAFHVST